MSTLINFRDFGGMQTAWGRPIRRDRLYRCGNLSTLAPADLEFVMALDFEIIADLRYAGERSDEVSPWPEHYTARVLAHDGDRDTEAPHLAMLREGSLTVAGVEQFYTDFYRELPFDPLYRPLFAATLIRMADTDGRTLVHCAAGKDRTGLLSALVLYGLGAARADIFDDFLRSSQAPGLVASKPKIIERGRQAFGHDIAPEAVDALLDVRRSYLEGALAAIESRCGSIEAYLAEGGVDAAVLMRLRDRLLET